MILYDTPGVIEKKMHKLDSMMMKNVRSAAINADCVVIVVDACRAPEKVFFYYFRKKGAVFASLIDCYLFGIRLMRCWNKESETLLVSYRPYWF